VRSAICADQARERISAALGAIDAAHDVLRNTSSDVVGNAFRVGIAERLETQDHTPHRADRLLLQAGFQSPRWHQVYAVIINAVTATKAA
jgi:hypothetical protein